MFCTIVLNIKVNIVIMHNCWFYFSKTSSPICRVADPVVLDGSKTDQIRVFFVGSISARSRDFLFESKTVRIKNRPDSGFLVESETGQIRVLLLFGSKTVLFQNRPDQKRSLSKTGRSILVGSKTGRIQLFWSDPKMAVAVYLWSDPDLIWSTGYKFPLKSGEIEPIFTP